MRRTFLLGAALIAGAAALPAQTTAPIMELRPLVGAYVPTGVQRDLFKDAMLFGAQAALQIKPALHVTGSFGWVPGRVKYQPYDDNVNIFTYDVGFELGLVRPVFRNWQFKPFFGLGGGGRTYAFAADELSNKTCASGYGSLGTEFQLGRSALRLEARDNVFCYKSPLPAGSSETRNDLAFSIGYAFHFR